MDKVFYTPGKPNDSLSGMKLHLLGIVVSLVVILGVYEWNAMQLEDVMTGVTESYAWDMTSQMADDISDQVEKDWRMLEMIATALVECPDDQDLQDCLEREGRMAEFTFLFIVDEFDGAIMLPEERMDLAECEGIQEAIQQGKRRMCIREGYSMVSVPFEREGGNRRVVVGVRMNEDAWDISDRISISEDTQFCIVDSDGGLVLQSDQSESFRYLYHESLNGEDEELLEACRQMVEDIAANRSGRLRFIDQDVRERLVTYCPIGTDGLTLMTMLPADLIVQEVDAYMLGTFLIISIILLVLLMLMMSSLRMYVSYNKRLEHMAYIDPLTGGLNNAAFCDRYRVLAKNLREDTCAVVMFNIKGFKLVNQNYGTDMGDKTICHMSRALGRCIGPDEFFGRSEMDHFFLCLMESDRKRIMDRLRAMEEQINMPDDETELPYKLIFAQGVYIVDDPNMEITIVQDRARAACQDLRLRDEAGCAFYSTALLQKLQMEMELDNLFADSIEHYDFQVYLQPKVSLDGRTLGGAEALVRWYHPVRGVISPGDFIPILEKSGKICRLDMYVFEQVCKIQRRQREEGKPVFPVSVNLSRQHFRDPEFLQLFFEVADEYDIRPGDVEFELTESIFLTEEQLSLVQDCLRQMHEHGFLCSMDDFGSGFSSLGMLKDFKVDVVKLDRSFFNNIENERTRSIIRCLVRLAQELKIQTVAEGIETQDQLEYLRQIGCDLVQGYIFSRPMPAADFEGWRTGCDLVVRESGGYVEA